MANMEISQRNTYERASYHDNASLRRLSRRGERIFAAYFFFLLAVLAGLTYWAVQVYDGWHHLIVLGDMVLCTLGIAAWVYPQRKHP